MPTRASPELSRAHFVRFLALGVEEVLIAPATAGGTKRAGRNRPLFLAPSVALKPRHSDRAAP
eukprot:8195256-Alexandrium_andersonii.AAC.1